MSPRYLYGFPLRTALALACVLLLLAVSGFAAPLVIPAGFDHFETFPGGTLFTLALPAGFLSFGGNPSDAFGPQDVFFMGYPAGLPSFPLTPILAPSGPGCHAHSAGGTHCNLAPSVPANADTVIARLNALTLPNIGDSGTIETEIVGLSLISVSPIVVTFSGGGPELLNVYAALNGDQTSGVLGVLRTGDSAIQFSTLIPMGAGVTFSFEHVPSLSILGSVNVDGVVQLREPWAFTVVPEPSMFAVLALAAAACLSFRLSGSRDWPRLLRRHPHGEPPVGCR